MRGLVVGASGLVGAALMGRLAAGSVGTFKTRFRQGLHFLDATDAESVRRLITASMPEVIFFPAAVPNVDWCETHPAEATEANLGPLRSTISVAGDIPIVAYSSDYVFSGEAGPYRELASVSPISVYGRIKVEVEKAVLEVGGTIIRSTGIFGWEPEPAKNFVLRLIASLRRGDIVRLPRDQVANPTYAEDLAVASLKIAENRESGTWHVAGPQLIARDEFGRQVARTFGLPESLIHGIATAELAQPAERPLLGGLRCERYLSRFETLPTSTLQESLDHLRALMEAGPERG